MPRECEGYATDGMNNYSKLIINCRKNPLIGV